MKVTVSDAARSFIEAAAVGSMSGSRRWAAPRSRFSRCRSGSLMASSSNRTTWGIWSCSCRRTLLPRRGWRFVVARGRSGRH